jgi:ribosomal protein L37AE/L43A
MNVCSKCGNQAEKDNPIRFVNGIGTCDRCATKDSETAEAKITTLEPKETKADEPKEVPRERKWGW